MKYILTLLLFLGSSSAVAKVHYLNLEMKRMPFQRSFFFPDIESWDHEVSLNFKASLWDEIFWLESDITGQARGSRFRRTWWDYTAGIRLTDEIDLVWDHYSDHKLDWDADKYQIRDSYGIRINFLR